MILREVEANYTSEQQLVDEAPYIPNLSAVDQELLNQEDGDELDAWEETLRNKDDGAGGEDGQCEEDDDDDEDQDDEDEESNYEDGTDHAEDDLSRYDISLSKEVVFAAKALLSCVKDPTSSSSTLLCLFKRLIFKIFTSQASDVATRRLFSPLEAYFMCMGLTPDGTFHTAAQLSSLFSKIQYLCLFSVLDECENSDMDSYECVSVK
jgi:hypothetical protein